MEKIPGINKLIGTSFKNVVDEQRKIYEEQYNYYKQLEEGAERAANTVGMRFSNALDAIFDSIKNDAEKVKKIWERSFNPPSIPEPESPKVDTSGLSPKFTTKNDKLSKEEKGALQAEIEEIEAMLRRFQIKMKQIQAELDKTYENGLISATEYYQKTAENIQEEIDMEIKVLQMKLAVEYDVSNQEKLRNQIVEKQLELQGKLWENNQKLIKDYKQLEKEIEKLNIEWEKFNGNLAKAAEMQAFQDKFEFINRLYSELANAQNMYNKALEEGNTEAIEKSRELVNIYSQSIERLKQMTYSDVLKAKLDEIKNGIDVTKAKQDAAIAEIQNKAEAGLMGRIEAQNEILKLQKKDAEYMVNVLIPAQKAYINEIYKDNREMREKLLAELAKVEQEQIKILNQLPEHVKVVKDAFESAYSSLFDNIFKQGMKIKNKCH